MTVKSASENGSYFAVRSGRNGVKTCLFFAWSDCCPHVDRVVEQGEGEGGDDNDGNNTADFDIQYQVFDVLRDALEYLDVLCVDKKTDNCLDSLRATTAVGESDHHQQQGAEETIMIANGIKPTSYIEKTQTLRTPETSTNTKSERQSSKKKRKQPFVSTDRPSTAQREISTSTQTQTQTKKRRIYKQWEEHCRKLKDYMESHAGCQEIDKNDTHHSKLRLWVKDQQLEYRKLQDGHPSNMTTPKIIKLQQIGFTFSYIPWAERISQIKAFKQIYGHLNVPRDHPHLGKWATHVRDQYKRFIQNTKKARTLTPDRVAQLHSLGFDFNFDFNADFDGPKRQQYQDAFDADFQTGLEKLKKYKVNYGDCLVKRNATDSELHGWVTKIRQEYKRLQEGNTCRLTSHHLQQLTDIGFVFRQKENYSTWKDKLEELRKFKTIHGHLNIATNHPNLGEFVGRMRRQYKWRINGINQTMTDERLAALEELGFDFQVGKWREQIAKAKTWDERFQELIHYKNKFGTTVVPQQTIGLGGWVKKQRQNLKKFRKGEKSPLTAQKALKLTDIGFVEDVFELRKQRKFPGATSTHAIEDEGMAMFPDKISTY